MTEGFLSSIEAQAQTETERILKELKALKFSADQVIHVLNALKLEVPKELRELSPIEVVPPITSSSGKGITITKAIDELETQKLSEPTPNRGSKGGLASLSARKKRAEKNYQTLRTGLLDALSKGPRLAREFYKQMSDRGYTAYAISEALKRMHKNGEVDKRTVGWQGPTEWFLPSRPVSLEKVRDVSLKVCKKGLVYDTEVSPTDVAHELGIDSNLVTNLMEELVEQGILTRPTASGIYTYEKPSIKAIPASRRYGRPDKRHMPVAGTGRRAKLSASKEVQQILAKAEAQGAQTKKQGNDHIQVKLGDRVAVLASSPGDNNRANREKLKGLGINV